MLVECNLCVFHDCRFYNTCNILKWDLMGLVFVFKVDTSKDLTKSHDISLILMVQWLPELRAEVWESFLSIPEKDPQHVSRHLVGFEALEVFATHDMGHSMSEYESCAVPMWRLYAIVCLVCSEMRTRMEVGVR